MNTVHQGENPPDVQALLRRFRLRPDKELGQNFLLDQDELRKIISVSDLSGDEWVVEIGAGLGSLTYYLSQAAQHVIAIEYDERLVPVLELLFGRHENVELVAADILKLNLEDFVGDRPYQIIANIPYNITSVLIRRLLESSNSPLRMILTLQKEVAERIVASQGQFSLLTLSVRVYGDPQIMGIIPAKAFYPQPQVDSAILRIDLHPSPIVSPELLPKFFQLAKIGFHQRRKQLKNSIAGGLGIPKDLASEWLCLAGITPTQRPQELGVEAWVRLAEVLSHQQE
jgi:16S rRNA (adenine1518-N6/adenine1519-N6)-dimethyltransferase